LPRTVVSTSLDTVSNVLCVSNENNRGRNAPSASPGIAGWNIFYNNNNNNNSYYYYYLLQLGCYPVLLYIFLRPQFAFFVPIAASSSSNSSSSSTNRVLLPRIVTAQDQKEY